MPVAAIGERSKGAILECEQRRIGALGRPRRDPRRPVAARTLATRPPPTSRTMST